MCTHTCLPEGGLVGVVSVRAVMVWESLNLAIASLHTHTHIHTHTHACARAHSHR